MGERPILAVVTVVLLLVLLVTAGLTAWWSDTRVQKLEERMTEMELLTPKLDAFRQKVEKDLSRVQDIQEAVATLQKTVAPMAKIDRSLDALSEKVGKDIGPEMAKISDILANLAGASTQLKNVSDTLTTMRQQMDKQGTDTAETLTGQSKSLQALATELKAISDAQTGLLTEVTKLAEQLKSISEAQGALAGTVEEVKTLTAQVDELQRSMNSLKKQLDDMQKKLTDTRRTGPT